MAAHFTSIVKIGVVARVRGRITSYRGAVQITASDVVIERDPNAEILEQLDEKEGTVLQELKAGRIEEVRKGIPLYTQRRFDVYPDVSKGGKFEE